MIALPSHKQRELNMANMYYSRLFKERYCALWLLPRVPPLPERTVAWQVCDKYAGMAVSRPMPLVMLETLP